MNSNLKVSQYKIVDAPIQSELREKVTREIQAGWQPWGSLTVGVQTSHLYQAMVLYDQPEKTE